MTEWEIAALTREAEQLTRDWTIGDAERVMRLAMIAQNIEALGGDASHIAPVSKPQNRSTRTSRAASTRRKG